MEAYPEACVVIPARMASTRLPGKPLAEIAGRPMIAHVIERAREADVGPVIVAAAEPEIAAAAEAAGARAVLTDPDLPSGSDRVWAALGEVDSEGRFAAVVNLQGDLPNLDPQAIRTVLAALAASEADIATLVAEIVDADERDNPNVPKAAVAFPPGSDVAPALYFSRTPIPSGDGPLWHHIGIYAYRRAALERFVSLPPGLLEARERLEQLRALEAGMRITAARVDTIPIGVDTPDDLARLRALLTSR